MFDAEQERADAQLMFDSFNRTGAAVKLLADGGEINLGPGVEFRVLRAVEDAAGGVDFWLMWKALGYQEGQQFTHTVRIVSVAAGDGMLTVTDSDDQALELRPYTDTAHWKQWLDYRRQNAPMFAALDAKLLVEHQQFADNWP